MFLTNKFLRKKAFLEGGVFKRMSKSVLRNRRDGSDIFDTTNRIINFANYNDHRNPLYSKSKILKFKDSTNYLIFYLYTILTEKIYLSYKEPMQAQATYFNQITTLMFNSCLF